MANMSIADVIAGLGSGNRNYLTREGIPFPYKVEPLGDEDRLSALGDASGREKSAAVNNTCQYIH